MKCLKRTIWMSPAAALLAGCVTLSSQDRGTGQERAEPLPGAPAPKFEKYRTPLSARAVDRRFTTKEAMFLANEMEMCGFPFFEAALASKLGAGDTDFQYMTTVESYWYSRYNMSALVTESRMGLHVVFGPYVTEWAVSEGRANDNRNRGEYTRSNKGVLLQEIVPMYQARCGFPRRFEDASPTMLQYASGDPSLVRPLDKGTQFESTENLIRHDGLKKIYGDDAVARPSGTGIAGNEMWKHRINYRENFLTLRWDHADMEHVIDLGAEGQTLMKQAVWMEYFFRQNHHEGRFLGNDPEEGFRGCMLNLMAVSKMLMLKGAMLYDGQRLTGVDPRSFQPGKHYFPHRIGVRLRMVGDLPPRPEELYVEDASSQLFDQASLLWGLSEYYHFADPSIPSNWNKVFGENPPHDGSVMEQKYLVLAEGLAHIVLNNIAVMHRREDGRLVSEWRPGSGPGKVIAAPDLGMALVALANTARHLHDPEDKALAKKILVENADFLVTALRADDGSIAEGYDFSAKALLDGRRSLLVEGFAVRGLMESWKQLKDERYLKAATGAYAFMNANLWDAQTGVYRSETGATVSVYTPLNLGAALGAMREMILATKDPREVERFKRFWVQGVDASGIQQSEYEETGERDFYAKDGDGDGIPRIEYAGGKHGYGIAPVFASRVEIETPPSPGENRN